jgi:hypothetical protein
MAKATYFVIGVALALIVQKTASMKMDNSECKQLPAVFNEVIPNDSHNEVKFALTNPLKFRLGNCGNNQDPSTV